MSLSLVGNVLIFLFGTMGIFMIVGHVLRARPKTVTVGSVESSPHQDVMKNRKKIAQLCFTYDQAQEASRDPKRRDKQSHYVTLACEYRKRLEDLTSQLMTTINTDRPALDEGVLEAVVELTYFNAWFYRRAGW
jgi:hypothetical protein